MTLANPPPSFPNAGKIANTREGLETLVRKHVDLVYAAALRQVRDPHLAADVTQAVFLLLQKKLPQLDRDTILTAWLLRTTRYTCLTALHQARRRRHHEHKAAAMRGEQQAAVVPEEWAQIIDAALLKLGDADRAALAGVYFEGLSHKELAERLGIREATAHKRVQRALAKLRRVLGGHGRRKLSEAAFGAVVEALGKPMTAPAAVSAAVMTCIGGKIPAQVAALAKGTMLMARVMKVKMAALALG
jgi:RNA polymerase sigma factor (sigma-70 family)